ncbi:unnamed protein product, partial [marine sediment metagenome]
MSKTNCITSTAGTCGGDPRISGTRIPVWLLINAWRLGISDDDMLRAYPS